ncbi:amidohydrolase family protein [Rhizobium hainanense]|uniref:2-amino-3-carboxymuconate-6-semialdehyde decarboxylase n=1 Tax=Rhizobium hainanense TaxID=52131 RepID=A0A1C3VP25_9HYPH|nr:amidohydrolase family protein [Rhizobium hainanense]SCB29522.1 aminocarboxymuconate-semialdehyde decarboxylase [Rhizobium hainanense]
MSGAKRGATGAFASGCACCGIDIHCHVVPAHFPLPAGGAAVRGWPSVVAADACHATVVIDDKPYRTVSDACWVAERRLEEMDRTGIRIQALSPMPELFGYWIETNAARDLVRYVNDAIAAIVGEGEGRFVGLGGVPLQDIDLAILELHRIVGELGFRGVEIGSNINGVPIGDPRFHPFFAEAERLGAAVFVHAVRPAGMDRLLGPAPLQQVLGYPTDVGLAAASVITGGLLQKLPKLRIAFSHGGGTFASLLPRLEQGYSAFPALNEIMTESPTMQARRLYVDSLVFDANMLRHLVAVFGEERVLLGTDYPFNFRENEPVARIEEALADANLRARLTFANARAFLGLDEV